MLLTPIAVLTILSPPHFSADGWGQLVCGVVGWCLFISGAIFRWWATLYIGARKELELVCHGPYSICRNPLYFGTFLLTLSIGAFLQSAMLTLAILVVTYLYLTVTVRHEEKVLRSHFGESFDRYLQRVPRFFPSPRLFQAPDVLELRVSGLYREAWRAARWVWIPVICQLVAHFRPTTAALQWLTLP